MFRLRRTRPRPPYLRPPEMPARARLHMAQARPLLQAEQDRARPRAPRYLLGLEPDLAPVWWDPAQGGPLQVASGGGRGSTTLLRAVVLQALRAGAPSVTVIDRRDGNDWAALAAWERVQVVALKDFGPLGGSGTPPGVRVGPEHVAAALAGAAQGPTAADPGAQARPLLVVDGAWQILYHLRVLGRRLERDARWHLDDLARGLGGVDLAVASTLPVGLGDTSDPSRRQTLALGTLTARSIHMLGVPDYLTPAGPGVWGVSLPARAGQVCWTAAPFSGAGAAELATINDSLKL